jgi:hypothetical protein
MSTRKSSQRIDSATLSQRIKLGIRRAKAEGKVIGSNGRKLAKQYHADAIRRAAGLLRVVSDFQRSGLSYRQMVDRLNGSSQRTPSGSGRWHVKTLQRLVERAVPALALQEKLHPELRILSEAGQEEVERAHSLLAANARERVRTEVLRARMHDLTSALAEALARARQIQSDSGSRSITPR